ncbi:MAG: hypothetical protein WC657_04335 [Candidatus Paceibacterota bacterium]|jgi:hypothetical protein
MSANTRLERNKELANLASLYAQAVGFVERGERSPQQVHALLSSLQFFKENRLLAAIPKQNTLPEPEQLQQLLSLKLSETDINRKTSAYLKGKGIEYVGELYLIDWGHCDVGKSVRSFQSSLGLPEELDVAEINWIPPYADRFFFWKMNQPLALFLQKDISHEVSMPTWLRNWYLSFEYTGQLYQVVRRHWGYGKFDMIAFHEVLKPSAKLRAGLYCPKSWTPPPDPPK